VPDAVAEEPVPQAAEDASYDGLNEAESAERTMDPQAADGGQTPVAAGPQKETEEQQDKAGIDPAFDSFVSSGRSKLDEIDALLKGEGS